MGFLSMLGLIFLVLKLIGIITWSWVFVLLPFFLIPIIWVLIIVGIIVYAKLILIK